MDTFLTDAEPHVADHVDYSSPRRLVSKLGTRSTEYSPA